MEIIAALFIAVWQIYGAEFADLLGQEEVREETPPAQDTPSG